MRKLEDLVGGDYFLLVSTFCSHPNVTRLVFVLTRCPTTTHKLWGTLNLLPRLVLASAPQQDLWSPYFYVTNFVCLHS